MYCDNKELHSTKETAVLIPSRIAAKLRRNYFISHIGIPIIVIGLILFFAIPASHAQQQNTQKADSTDGPKAQYTAEGTEHCVRCHSGERITNMAKTLHGDKENPHTPYAKQGCESCHGPGSLHVSRARGGRGFPLLIAFREEEEAVQRHTEACIGCHGKDVGKQKGMEWNGSVHAVEDMTCVNCHELHIEGNPLKEQKQQVEVCANCHDEQITNHRRFEKVGIVFDKLTCYECHDIHQLEREP
jgi:predicted CXXCH cytochrome family protein